VTSKIGLALTTLESQHAKRKRRVVDSAQSPQIQVDGHERVSFASNDYLGLANHPLLKQAMIEGVERYGVGAGASHLVSGHMQAHHAFEEDAARFFGTEAALLFSSGYAANLGILVALADRESVIYSDKLNHACIIDGAHLSRATVRRYAHVDLEQLAALLHEDARVKPEQNRVIVSDAVFSMDGDIADIPQLLALARQYDAWLVLDDAHGFGVLGEGGRGSVSHCGLAHASYDKLVYMATLGKSAGVAGAVVAATRDVVEWLVNRARTYVFATAMPPAQAHTLRASLQLVATSDERRAHLRSLIATLQQWPQLTRSQTAIQPLIVGENEPTLALAKALDEQGLWVPAIRPPTVPAGQARLRISLSAAHTMAQLQQLISALQACHALR
jgi:8-amino-7-oxononanoate synthase